MTTRLTILLVMFNNVLSSKLTVKVAEMLRELCRKGNTASRKCSSSKAKDLIAGSIAERVVRPKM
jgi:hypothetical protein